MRFFGRRNYTKVHEIAPDEIFLDSSNLPGLEASQFEGRVERPISRNAMLAMSIIFLVVVFAFSARAFELQVVSGEKYQHIALNNGLDHSIIFAARGTISDRTGRGLAWNEPSSASSTPFAIRKYLEIPGLAHILGFVQYPKQDSSGAWWREEYAGVSGVELSLHSELQGSNGEQMVEKDALGHVVRSDIVAPPQNGTDVHLSIDASVQSKLYQILNAHAAEQHFQGGAAVIMDVRTGELIALTSFPEYDHAGYAAGDATAVKAAASSLKTPLINRAISGVYAPGSIVKPIFAAAALAEGIISPEKQILSKGQIEIPNPYDPKHPSIFKDWKPHGWIDMRTAIAVSSDEYFYTIGGGYGDQPGLGIAKIDEYARMFGLGSSTGATFLGESSGVIPTPSWKVQNFGTDDPWRIGDTYHTAIGQYGFQITPVQAARYVAAIANGGHLLTPHIIASSTPQFTNIPIPDADFQVVREGMRLAVTSTRSDATAKSLEMGALHIAGKTGTAQIGFHNENMNSWAVGFWPAENPHYAFAVVLERAPAGTLSGAAPGIRPFFEWLVANHPEYLD